MHLIPRPQTMCNLVLFFHPKFLKKEKTIEFPDVRGQPKIFHNYQWLPVLALQAIKRLTGNWIQTLQEAQNVLFLLK